MTYRKSLRTLAERFVGVTGSARSNDLDWWKRKAEKWSSDPWAFFTAKDPDGHPLIWTKDQRSPTAPVKPFPEYMTYLRVITEQIQSKSFVFVDKPRQMFLSSLTLLYIYWDCQFHDHREWLISKTKAPEAYKLMRDKIRFVHSKIHPAFRTLYPISATPERLIRFHRSGSECIGVPANFYESEGRGSTGSGALIDEASLQPGLEEMLGSLVSNTDKILVIGTPQLGAGAKTMQAYVTAPAEGPQPLIVHAGLEVKETSKATVILLDYCADPRKDVAWANLEKKRYGSDVRWRREMERDWTSSAGKPYYPDFAEKPEIYIRKYEGSLLARPVACGWDYGYHHPAAVFGQYSPAQDTAWIMREITPHDIDIHSFARLVLYCRGQLPYEALLQFPKALFWVAKMKADPHTENPPWFPPGTTFADYASHEANKKSSMSSAGSQELSDGDVCRSLGIPIVARQSRRAHRKTVIDRLLLVKENGLPGFLVDPSCRDVIAGWRGGIIYEKETPANPNPTDPAKNGSYEHTHDCVGEWLVEEAPEGPDRIIQAVGSMGYHELSGVSW